MLGKAKLLQPFGKTTLLTLILLSVFFVVTKLPFLTTGTIPFTFDHGKDSLAIFHMWQTASPKFIGPWTSIPGLFFGPGWYYLLLPAYMLGMGNPVAPVALMVVLGVVQIVLVGRYFGTPAAVIIAASQTWATLAQSAWNPFPMTLCTILMLIILQRIDHTRTVSPRQGFFTGFVLSMGFHFSTAFAIFYPILIASFFLLRKLLPSRKVLLLSLLGFCIPFIPQLIFEVRHDFIQSQAIVRYLQVGDAQVVEKPTLGFILFQTFSELQFAIVPTSHYFSDSVRGLIAAVYLGSYIVAIYQLKRAKKNVFMLSDSVVWVIVPVLGFTLLHFNYWYLLGIVPIWLILAGQALLALPKGLRISLLGLYLAMPVLQVLYFYNHDIETLQQSRQFLPIKLAVLEFIRADAGEVPFSSYHYVPDIYDYSYQYLYFSQALHGKKLPVEFSYKPGEIAYATEKPDLLARFATVQQQGPAEKLYYIVEKADNQQFLQSWWDAQSFGEIIAEHNFGEEVSVYVATPAKE